MSELPDGVGTADADKATPMKTYVHKGAHPAHVTRPVPSVRQLSYLGGAAQPCAQIRPNARSLRPPVSACGGAGCQSGAAEAIAPLDDRTILRSITKFYGLADATLQESLVYRGASASPKKLYSVSHGARQVLLAAPIDAKRPLRCAPEPHRTGRMRIASARGHGVCVCVCVQRRGTWASGIRETGGALAVHRSRGLGVLGRAGVVVDGQRWSTLHRTDGRRTAACG